MAILITLLKAVCVSNTLVDGYLERLVDSLNPLAVTQRIVMVI